MTCVSLPRLYQWPDVVVGQKKIVQEAFLCVHGQPSGPPHQIFATVLYHMITEQLETFLASFEADSDATDLPASVQRDFTPICGVGFLPMAFCACDVTPPRRSCCCPSPSPLQLLPTGRPEARELGNPCILSLVVLVVEHVVCTEAPREDACNLRDELPFVPGK